MKKIVVALLALSVVFMFASCDNSGNPSAPTELETVLDDFKDDFFSLFNAVEAAGWEQAGKYTAEQLNEKLNQNVEYFYELDGNYEDSAKVKVLGQEFASSDTFAVSIGLNNFFTDNVFKVLDGKLSVNKAVVLMSLMFDMPLEVNGTVIAENLGATTVSDLAINEMDIAKKEAGNTINKTTDAAGNEYDVHIADATGLISFTYDGKEDGDVVLILNEDSEEVVKSTAVDKAAASDFGYYLVSGSTSGRPAETVIRDNIVIDSTGAVKGKYTITFNMTFPEGE